MTPVSDEAFAALKKIDSATVANAIETFDVRPRTWGYTGQEIRCLFPEKGVMLGYAATAVMGPRDSGEADWRQGWLDFTQAVEDTPGDSIAVIADSRLWPFQAALVGEVMATIMMRLGAVGCLSNGAVRDVEQMDEMGFHCHAAGVIVSHGSMQFLQTQQPVQLGRLTVRPGDLIHGDVNGVVAIPTEIADGIPAAAERLMAAEQEIMADTRRADFRAADLKRFY